MLIKIITLFVLVLFLGCTQSTVSDTGTVSYKYHITEKDLPFDTIIVVKDLGKYITMSIVSNNEWNDTIIHSGYKMPRQKKYFESSIENYFNNDTIKISIKKYKATEVDIYEEREFY